MDNKNSIVIGLALGAIVPVVGYLLIDFIFLQLQNMGLMDEVKIMAYSSRERTTTLIALCCNLIPFNISRKRRWDNTMRGIIFPTLIYVGFWIYRYYAVLF